MKTPYILFKPKILEQNYKEFERLCQTYLEDYVIAYSVKTNSFPEVIKILSELGSNFEIASLNEILKVREICDKSFIFNGCCKNSEELRIAIENKFLINADSKSEINKISTILEDLGISSFNIGLRISLNKSKFGFDTEELKDIIEYCRKKRLNVIALHFHGGTNQTLNSFENNIKEICKIVHKVIMLGVRLTYLDLGGGFPENSQLKNLGVKLEDYFKVIEKYTGEFDYSIILEPGRFLVADAFDLITEVCAIKEKKEGNYAILDAGINILPKVVLANYKFKKLEYTNIDKTKEKKEYILAGPLLFNNDTLGKFHGILKENDLIKVENVGAYCYNLAWTISYDKPKIYIE